jgi:hypothetical protein
MSPNPADQLLAAARMLISIDALGASVETSDFQGRPAIEHLVEAYDALTPADWPARADDVTWRVFTAAKMVASIFHLGGSIEESTFNGRTPLAFLAEAVGNLPSPDLEATI